MDAKRLIFYKNVLFEHDKDTIPPQLIGSDPELEEVLYTKKRVTFTFDEDIGVKNLRENLVITPNFEDKLVYKALVRGKKLVIGFEEPLDSNRTYTVNLYGGVVDLTESNVADDIALSFSTGEAIDSISVLGRILWAETQKAVKGAFVHLVPVEPVGEETATPAETAEAEEAEEPEEAEVTAEPGEPVEAPAEEAEEAAETLEG